MRNVVCVGYVGYQEVKNMSEYDKLNIVPDKPEFKRGDIFHLLMVKDGVARLEAEEDRFSKGYALGFKYNFEIPVERLIKSFKYVSDITISVEVKKCIHCSAEIKKAGKILTLCKECGNEADYEIEPSKNF